MGFWFFFLCVIEPRGQWEVLLGGNQGLSSLLPSVPAVGSRGERHRKCWSEAHPKDHLVFVLAQYSPLQNERFLQLLLSSNETSMEFPSSPECFITLNYRFLLLMSDLQQLKPVTVLVNTGVGIKEFAFLLWSFTCSMTYHVTFLYNFFIP